MINIQKGTKDMLPKDSFKWQRVREVMLELARKYNLKEIYIGDINAELMNTYRIVRDDIDALITTLLRLQNEFVRLDTDARRIYYNDKYRFSRA